MAAVVSPFGPGTITVGATPMDFSCEVMGGAVTHAYEETTAARTRLCGDAVPATQTRTDGLTFDLENDLTAAGLYAYLQANDMTVQPVEYAPNTALAASWSGDVTVRLPDTIGADEFGAPIVSSVEWAGVGPLVFTPGTAPVVLAGSPTEQPAPPARERRADAG